MFSNLDDVIAKEIFEDIEVLIGPPGAGETFIEKESQKLDMLRCRRPDL